MGDRRDQDERVTVPPPYRADHEAVRVALIATLERLETEKQELLRRRSELEARVASLTEQLSTQEADSRERLELVGKLQARLADTEADSQQRLADMAELSRLLADTEADSQRRLADVRKLETHVRELEARVAEMSRRLVATEADSQRRLAVLKEYTAQNLALKQLLAGGKAAVGGKGGLSAEDLDPADGARDLAERRASRPPAAPVRDVITVIRPPKKTASIDFGELWRFRHLFTMLVWRSIRVEFDAMRLGSLWAIIRPLLLAYVFAFFRGLSAANTYVDLPYLLYVYSGLLLWTYFTDATSNCAVAIRLDTALLTKIYYPRLLTPLVPIVSSLVTLALGLVPLVVMMAWYEVWPGWAILLLPVVVGLCAALSLGIGTFVSSLSIENRDWERVLLFGLTIALWLSPVIYAPGMIPERVQWLFMLNPTTGILLGFRAALFHEVEVPVLQLAYAASITLAILALGVYAFRRTEAQLADRL